MGDGTYQIDVGSRKQLAYAVAGQETWVFLDGRTYVVADESDRRRATADDPSALAAPMPATVLSIDVTAGQDVTRDTVLIMLEAMKMELPIKAPCDGRVTAIHCRKGELVQPGVPLLDLS
jgi:3-methylcrotonyl-CoA carboxylase alpha subunit